MRRTAATTVWLLCFVFLATGLTRRTVAQPEPRPIPRTPDGRPDFQGVWNFATLTPLERSNEFADKSSVGDAEAAEFVRRQLATANADNRPRADYNEFWFERPTSMARLNGGNLTSRIIEPRDGRIPPLTRAAQDRVAAVQEARRDHPADGAEDRTMPERCLSASPLIEPAGGGTNNLLDIVQTPNHLALHTELMSVLRIVSIGRRDHLPLSIGLSKGDSVARWEGDTLLVDTTNYVGRFDFMFSAVDENLHLVERFQLLDQKTLLIEQTIDDPTAFSKPWTVALTLARVDARTFEYACHEGNYGLRNILSGARAEEAELGRRPK